MSIAERLLTVKRRIEEAAIQAHREPAEVTLIAVTKQVPVEWIEEAYAAGHRHFGESKLQEAIPKILALPQDATWHFMGNMQSNKARAIAANFSVIHSLSNLRQLAQLDTSTQVVECLVEVNLAEETQKGGVNENGLDAFLSSVLHSSQVKFRGLMTVGPAMVDSESLRPLFRRLRELNRLAG